MKLSSLTKRERNLAERIAGGPVERLDEPALLGVGFVLARRKDPTVPLIRYQATHDADAVRDRIDDKPKPKTSGKSKAGGSK